MSKTILKPTTSVILPTVQSEFTSTKRSKKTVKLSRRALKQLGKIETSVIRPIMYDLVPRSQLQQPTIMMLIPQPHAYTFTVNDVANYRKTALYRAPKFMDYTPGARTRVIDIIRTKGFMQSKHIQSDLAAHGICLDNRQIGAIRRHHISRDAQAKILADALKRFNKKAIK